MKKHIAVVERVCPRCSATAQRTYIAESSTRGLRVSSSLLCPTCSLTEESHGPELPDDARDAFYALEGRWSLQVVGLANPQSGVLQVLRKLSTRSPGELMRSIRDKQPIIVGTLVEIEQAEAMLGEAGANVAVHRLEE